jgi:hypothetical protein
MGGKDMHKSLIFGLVMGTFASPSGAQQRVPERIADSSVAKMMSEVRRTNQPGSNTSNSVLISRILCDAQSAGRFEFADSIVRLAIEATDAEGLAGRGLIALTSAGTQGPPLCDTFSRAYDLLTVVHRDARNLGMRRMALRRLLNFSDRFDQTVPFLRNLAVSSDKTARDAVEALLQISQVNSIGRTATASVRAQAEAILKDLFERDLVKDGPITDFSTGASQLWLFGMGKGWIRR